MSTSHRSETTTLGDFADFFAQAEPQEQEPEPPAPTVARKSQNKAKAVPEPTAQTEVSRREEVKIPMMDDSRDFLHVATALANLKSELLQAGLLQKTNVKSSFLQVTEYVATRPKQSDDDKSPLVAQKFRYQRQQLLSIAAQMGEAQNLDELLKTVMSAIQEALSSDRVVIYRFESNTSGQVITETLARGFTPMLGNPVAVPCFGEDRAEEYDLNQAIVIDDTERSGLTPHQRQLFEQYQIKSSLSVPVLPAGQIWGLLAIHQCFKARPWQESEISFVNQLCLQLSINMGRFEAELKLKQKVELDRTVSRVIDRIRQSTEIDKLFKTTTQEVRQLLRADRVTLYKFYPDWSGEFVAESVAAGWAKFVGPDLKTVWEDTHLQETQGGRYRKNETYVADDIYAMGHAQCHIDILEQFEIKAYIIAPVFVGQKLWGLLAAYQNSGARTWESAEVSVVSDIGSQLGLIVRQTELLRDAQLRSEHEKSLAKITENIRKSLDVRSILRNVTQEIRQQLQADRVSVYRFNSDWSGEYLAESVATGWEPLVGPGIKTVWTDTHLQETQGGRYRNNETYAVDDIYKAGHFQCHVEILEQFQIAAYVIAPIFAGDKLWGLLAAYQNSGPRRWKPLEISLLAEVGPQLGMSIQQIELLNRAQLQAEREKTVAKIIENVRKSLDVKNIFRVSTQEVRQLLQADRVALYRFDADWGGEFVAESVATGWVPLVGPGIRTVWADTYLQDTQGGRYRNNETFKVEDIYRAGDIQNAGLSSCHIEILEQFQAKSYVIAPVFSGTRLWGLLAAYQNSSPRDWEDSEVSLLTQIGLQLGVAIQQAELLAQTQKQAEREKTLARVIDRIRQSLDVARQLLDINTIFHVTTLEVRQMLQADRVALYEFQPDWSGSFIAESFSAGWSPLVGTEVGTDVKDTYLKETQGGRYQKGESLAVDDIYAIGHDPCHVQLLEKFECKAYVLVPVFVDQKLWGILCAYQNATTRHWEAEEVTLLHQIALQMGVALEQFRTLEQLRIQSDQLTAASVKDKAANEKLQQQIMQMLIAVRPVLSGDLTVRVPVSEDAVGTIADAYNNTIQSLRKIVTQVQSASVKMSATSNSSEMAIATLSKEAQQQFQQVTQAIDRIQSMVNSTQAVTENAKQVQTAVQQANQTVKAGDTAMNKTVDGIMAIRETVAETSKKIKRLSESSQKISKVVSLISNFTTQTQLLALNASIEATRAGEYGRGFSVVADEVRSLSRQSAEATREIEKLVQEIQAETVEVTTAMDIGIQQVVGGTNLVNETRQQLNEIVTATAQISQLVQGITQATQVQTQQSQLVTQAMSDVAAIANKTSTDSTQISASFQELLATAQQLQASVGQFKVN